MSNIKETKIQGLYILERPTFGLVQTFIFDDKHRFAIFVSKGLGNSFCVAGKKDVDYVYFVDDYYRGLPAPAVIWNDPDLNVRWPIRNPIISDKDSKSPALRQLFPGKF